MPRKAMKKITVAELEAMLLSLPKRANIITIQTATPLKMRKTDNPHYGQVFKHSTVNVQIQSDYENAVNLRRAKEGKPADFIAQARTWGERVDDTCVVEHKGTKYMAYRALRCLKTKLRDPRGRFVSRNALLRWIPQAGKAKKQGLENEIIWRTPKLQNIRRININRKRFEIVQG